MLIISLLTIGATAIFKFKKTSAADQKVKATIRNACLAFIFLFISLAFLLFIFGYLYEFFILFSIGVALNIYIFFAEKQGRSKLDFLALIIIIVSYLILLVIFITKLKY